MKTDGTPAPAPLRLGHAGRLRMSRREIALVIGHLLLVALALEDEDVLATLRALAGWGDATAAAVGVMLKLGILAAWGALTLAWVRCRGGGES